VRHRGAQCEPPGLPRNRMGQTLAEAMTAFAGCKSLQGLRFRGEKPKSWASSREEPVISRRMGIPTAKVGPRQPQVAGLAPPQSRVLPTPMCRAIPYTTRDGWWKLATLRRIAAACRGSHKLEAKDAQAPQKAPNQARSPYWVFPCRAFPSEYLPVASSWHRERDRQGPCLASETLPLQNPPVMNLSLSHEPARDSGVRPCFSQ
jgi:hypothetical protein